MSASESAGAAMSTGAPAFLRNSIARANLTKADAAYGEIRARILSCELAPGSVIDQEMLANWLGSSTTPVREALRRLEAERLVILRAHSDVRVAPVSIEEFREFHSVRLGLEPLLAAEAAAIATAADVAKLREIVATASAFSDPSSVELDRSRTFHWTIYAMSGNVTMTQILDNIWDRVSRYRRLFARVGSVAQCASPEHLVIIDAIESHDGDRAAELMRTDLVKTFAKIMPDFEEAMRASG